MQHLALIMDGNRRWARKRGLPIWRGHKKGIDGLRAAVRFCLDSTIPYLTVYAFSTENFKRPAKELSYLFDIIAKELISREFKDLLSQGVRVRFIGDKSLYPPQLKDAIKEVEEQTIAGSRLTLNMLFCYGGQQEIVSGIKSIVEQVGRGELSVNEITPARFASCLWMNDIPAPDLIVRTGGQQRLSNFLLYHAAYAELVFLDCYWPEITEAHLSEVVEQFRSRQRNFGV